MPWTEKQLKLFRAAAHNPAIAKSSGIKQSDAARMAKEGLKKAKGGLTRAEINKQDTRHGKMDMPFAKLNRYAGMKKGGIMKKRRFNGEEESYVDDSVEPEVERSTRVSAPVRTEEKPKSARKTTRKAARKSESSPQPLNPDLDYDKGELSRRLSQRPAADHDRGELARRTSQRVFPQVPYKKGGSVMRSKRDIGRDQMAMAPYKKGGEMKESKAMMKKEISFFKKKGAPKSMIKHEEAEMKGMARGGGVERRGKTKGTVIKMASGGYVRAADGITQRGKTKGKIV